jgi:hypothetical protein
MFNKKKCNKCGNKLNDKYSFCPHCGNSQENSKDEETWGLLGKNDVVKETAPFSDPFFGGIGGGMLGKVLGNTLKMLEKEMQKEMKGMDSMNSPPKTNFELIINGKRIDPRNIKVTRYAPNQKIENKATIKKVLPSFSEENVKISKKLKKQEPKTNLRRLSNRVVYELEIPEVKSINDVSIIQLENSIEIKAIGKNKLYSKIIPINLPIVDYSLDNEKLVLELEAK